MKIKFSKVMAIVCAVSVAFAGLTAFAAAPGTVVTTTNYDTFAAEGTSVSVETDIYGDPNAEITYYVEDSEGIVYINQKTANGEGFTDFTFTSTHGRVLSAIAKFGTDGTAKFPTFTFVEGSNRLTNGTANVSLLDEDPGYAQNVAYTVDGTNGTAAYAFKAKVSGNAAEYGIMVGTEKFPAAGCLDDGTFMVVIEGVENKLSQGIYAYAIDAVDATVDTVAIIEATPAQ